MALWTPAEITTALWLDADDSGTITLDASSNVEQWNDKSGNNLNVAQGTAVNRPTYNEAVLNGLPVIGFSSGKVLVSATNEPVLASGSIFAVFRSSNINAQQGVLCKSNPNNSGYADWEFQYGIRPITAGTDGKRETYIYGSSSAANLLSTSNLANNEWIFGSTNFSSNSLAHFTNGATDGLSSPSVAGLDFSKSISNRFYVGARRSGLAHLVGEIAEIVLIPEIVSVENRQKLEGYLAWKWGLEGELPVGHPYKSAAPGTEGHIFTVTTNGSLLSEGDTEESLDPFSVQTGGSLWDEIDTQESLDPFSVTTGGSLLHEEDTEESLDSFSVNTTGQIQYELELILPGAFTAETTGELLHGEIDVTGAARQYEFRLTGKADGLADVTIPIKSFQSRLKSGDPSYLSVVIPTYDYADDVTARSNGQMVLRMRYVQDGEVLDYTEIARVDLDDIQVDRGTKSKSITLIGYGTEIYSAKSITLENATYHNLSDGNLRYRCKPNLYVRPGDTVTIDGNTFTANTISWSVSEQSETFEVTEAD